MQYNKEFLTAIVGIALGGIALGAAVVYLVAENGGLLVKLTELLEDAPQSAIGFTA